ncbi:MAG: hypothetical protein ACD_84C00031G0002 [uncultured bacterium]|nr:MAG: hypothetical protein ACD_84C00031G0002 [uncultured bacterium]
MELLNRLFKILFLLIVRLKGKNKFIEVKCNDVVIGRLVAYSILGHEIEICCQKKHYRRQYDKWFISDKDVIVYRVFSITSSNMPEAIKKLFRLDLDIPAFLPVGMCEDTQQHTVINAYVDILLDRLEKGNEVIKK